MRPFVRACRAAATGIALAAVLGACQMSVDVTTTVRSGGSGTFKIRFAFDKELIDVVGSTPDGKSSLEQLKAIPGSFSQSGWAVTQSDAGGGLTIDVAREFASPAELNRAVVALHTQGSSPFPNIFKTLHLTRTAGFFSTTTTLSGSIDLSASGLLPPGALSDEQTKTLFEQAAAKVLVFRVRASLPGTVKSFTGDPEDVSGGTITWAPSFGKELAFSARANGLNPTVFVVAALPVAAALGAAVVLTVRRRRRRSAVTAPGWDVAATSADDVAPDAPPPRASAPTAGAGAGDPHPEIAPPIGSETSLGTSRTPTAGESEPNPER